MKKLNLLILGLGLLNVLFFSNCASDNGDNEDNTDTTIVQLEEKMNDIESGDTTNLKSDGAANQLGKEYTSKYICPDHCKGSGSEKAGTCSGCGMELIENPNFAQKK